MAERLSVNMGVRDSLVMPRLEIHIPMPPGAAVPARTPQTPPPAQADPGQPAAAQSR